MIFCFTLDSYLIHIETFINKIHCYRRRRAAVPLGGGDVNETIY